MTSPPWEPQPPFPWQPGWQQPGPSQPFGDPRFSGPPAGGPWPPSATPYSYGPPVPGSYGQAPNPYGPYGFTVSPPPRSHNWWLIGMAIAAVLVVIGLVAAVLYGSNSRDEPSYQAGRKAGSLSYVMSRFGGSTAEDACDGQFVLSTPIGERRKYDRSDFMEGCLDAVRDAKSGTP